MPKFRKKPVVIEAFQLPSNEGNPDLTRFTNWARNQGLIDYTVENQGISIKTLEGVMRADPLDWIIKGVQGEFYPCKPDIFEATYEAVE